MPVYGALTWIVGGLLTPVPVLRHAFLMKIVTHHCPGLSMFFLVTKVGYKKAVFSLDAVATANLMCIMQAKILPECERSTSTKTQPG
jgi:hypothetical protein